MTINHWEDFKRASGRSYKFSDEAFQVLFDYYNENYPDEDIEVNYDLLGWWEEYEEPYLALDRAKLDNLRDKLWIDNMERDGIAYEEGMDLLYEYEPETDQLNDAALKYLREQYETILESEYSQLIVIDHGSKKP